jgi:hypothetical protein
VIVIAVGGGTAATGMDCNNADGPATDHQLYHNTIVVRSTATACIFLPWLSEDLTGPSSGTSIKQCHSNIYANYLAGASDVYRFCEGPGGAPPSANYVRTFGYNLFYLPGGKSYSGPGPYWRPWDPDDSDSPEGESYWATDTLSTTTDPFNAPSTAWDWEDVNGSGYTLPLAGDFRVTADSGFRDLGLSGSVPGAIEDTFGSPSEPPTWNDIPVGPDNPAFLFPAPDGLVTAIRIQRNTVLEMRQLVEGVLESVSKVSNGMATVATNTANYDMALPAGSRIFMMETDADIVVQLNSQTFAMLAGGCVVLGGASLNTFKVSNASTVKQAILKFMGAN